MNEYLGCTNNEKVKFAEQGPYSNTIGCKYRQGGATQEFLEIYNNVPSSFGLASTLKQGALFLFCVIEDSLYFGWKPTFQETIQ